MNRTKDILKVLLMCAIFMLVGVIFCKDSVFADGYGYVDIDASTPPPSSGDTTGGTCSESDMRWAPWCSGASWVYYKAMNQAPQGSVLFGTEATELQNNSSKQVYVPSECQGTDEYGNNIGGFWHYGMNGQGIMFTGWYNSVYYTNKVRFQRSLYNLDLYNIGGAGQWGHWGTVGYNIYSWWTEKPLVNISHDILDSNGYTIYTAQKSDYGTTGGEVAKNFYDACWKDSRISDEDKPSICGTDKENASIPTGTYLFCYWDGMSSNFYGKSGASAGGSTEETNIVSMGSMASAADVTVDIKVNEEATLNFYHKVYSDNSDSQINWKVNRNAGPQSFLNNGSGYEVISGRPSGSTASGTVTFGNNKESGKYISNSGSTVLSDGGIKIKFTAKGTYTFCETLVLNKEGENNNYTSKACVTVNVDGGGSSGGDTPPEINYTAGISKVISRIKNVGLSQRKLDSVYAGWKGILASGANKVAENKVASEEKDDDTNRNVTYAKPDDVIEWVNEYSPGAQESRNSEVVYINGVEKGSHGAHEAENTSNSYVTFRSDSGVSADNWKNIYSVTTDSPYGLNNRSLKIDTKKTTGWLDIGVNDVSRKEVKNNLKISGSDVGYTYYDDIKTEDKTPSKAVVDNEGRHSWTKKVLVYPGGCNWCPGENGAPGGWCAPCWDDYYEDKDFSHSNDVTKGTYATDLLESKSFVKIPYNFINEASFTLKGKEEEGIGQVVYAGEDVNVENFVLNVKTRENTVTEANYATIVRNAQVKLIAYVTEEANSAVPFSNGSCSGGSIACNIAQEYSGSLNHNMLTANKGNTLNGTNYGGTVEGVKFGGDYKVFDAKAGTYFCMAVAVYPANSGDDKNMEAKGNGEWAVSSPQCIVVAKKPSFQIWGNGVYSVNGIDALASEKHNVYGVYNETSPLVGGGVVFGSWVEQSIIVRNGTVNKVASGAAMGKDNSGNQINYGWKGNIENDFCNGMVPLTFTNCIGNSKEAGKSGIDPPTTNVSALVDYWSIDSDDPCSNIGEIEGKKARSGNINKDICISDVDDDVTIGGGRIGEYQTDIVKAKNVSIAGEITYWNGGFNKISEMPKAVIYANGDIKIDCDVNRIDAILIAEGTVYTCGNYHGVGTVSDKDENSTRSHQLIINGAVIAKKIELGRTYGNTMGLASNDEGDRYDSTHVSVGSETPAEILNYDASILLWGESMASAEDSNTLTVTYQHELAPRY